MWDPLDIHSAKAVEMIFVLMRIEIALHNIDLLQVLDCSA